MPEEYELWRDFDWDEFTREESKKYPSDAEKHALREAVRAVREFLRVFASSKPSPEDLQKVIQIEQHMPRPVLFHSLVILAQLATIADKKKRELDNQLTFAVTAISHAAKHCKQRDFDRVLPVLTRFAKEF